METGIKVTRGKENMEKIKYEDYGKEKYGKSGIRKSKYEQKK